MNKILIITVLAAFLIIGGAVMFVKSGAAPTTVNAQQEADISDCTEGDQCIVVDTHCGFCCDYLAINAKHEQSYSRSFDKKCSRYMGNYCSCFDLTQYPSCVAGKCQLVKWPDKVEDAPRPAPQPEPEAQPEPLPPQPVTAPLPAAQLPPEPDYFPAPEPAPSVEPAPIYTPPPQTENDGFESEGDIPESAPEDDSLYAPLPATPPAGLFTQDGGFNDGFDSRFDGGRDDDPLNKPLPSGNIEP